MRASAGETSLWMRGLPNRAFRRARRPTFLLTDLLRSEETSPRSCFEVYLAAHGYVADHDESTGVHSSRSIQRDARLPRRPRPRGARNLGSQRRPRQAWLRYSATAARECRFARFEEARRRDGLLHVVPCGRPERRGGDDRNHGRTTRG